MKINDSIQGILFTSATHLKLKATDRTPNKIKKSKPRLVQV